MIKWNSLSKDILHSMRRRCIAKRLLEFYNYFISEKKLSCIHFSRKVIPVN